MGNVSSEKEIIFLKNQMKMLDMKNVILETKNPSTSVLTDWTQQMKKKKKMNLITDREIEITQTEIHTHTK